jgi:hypothetical protein
VAHLTADRVRETSTTTGTGALTLAGAVAGFRTFGSVLANGDTAYYVVAHRDADEWEVGLGTWGTGGILTRTTVLSSSNAGALVNFSAGTKDVHLTIPADRNAQFDDALALPFPLAGGIPSAPADGLKVFAIGRAGRTLPGFIGPSGVDSFLQPALFGNRVMLITPGSGTAVGSSGLTPTTAATLSHPSLSTATLAQSLYRTRFTTSTSAGSASGVRDGTATHWRGNSAGRGGFMVHMRIATGSIALSGGQMMAGLSSSTSALAGEPSSSMADFIGICKDSADTNLFFSRRTGSGSATKVDLGIAYAANVVLDLWLFSRPNGSNIGARVVRQNFDGTSTVLLDTTYNTDIPANTTFLARHVQVRNGAVAAAADVDMVRVYSESDF